MPPHCDTLDGPLIMTARKALETKNVNLILTWAPKEAEKEITESFEKTITIRNNDDQTKEIADRWFFETVVRLHREGEGAHFSGLKPAGLDAGPVIPLAEEGYANKDTTRVIDYLQGELKRDIENRFEKVMNTINFQSDDIEAGRKHIDALLDYLTHSHKLFKLMQST